LSEEKRIILIGASVGKAWRIEFLPKRIESSGFVFEYVFGGYQFDKSEILRRVLSRSKNRADAIILKECAAYFPGNLSYYKDLMKGWISICQKESVIPIPATVAPVTRTHAIKRAIINLLRGKNPLKGGDLLGKKRMRQILEYNDWIRNYCKKININYLDLEGALRYSEKNRYLRGEFARVDGLHLNKKAYNILDKKVIETLEKIIWP